MLTYSSPYWVWNGPFAWRHLAREAGFQWSPTKKRWVSRSIWEAYALRKHVEGEEATRLLGEIEVRVHESQTIDDLLIPARIPHPPGVEWFPYQQAGVDFLSRRLRDHKAVLCGDEQGLGKTAQALGVANVRGAKILLVVCPASLRWNWEREIRRWHLYAGEEIQVVTGGTAVPHRRKTTVVSYNLVHTVAEHRPDLVIVDEAHFLAHANTQRTTALLRGPHALVGRAPTVFLSGTPVPNRPHQIWPILARCAPEVIDHLSLHQFTQRFCLSFEENGETRVTGAQRQDELYARLRGSGFLLRRLKKDVLTELPPKRRDLVILDARGKEMKEVLRAEEQFSAEEILRHGAPVGTVLPELRRQMGIAKVPQVAQYLRELLDSGANKVVVFGHHQEVLERLHALLDKEYGAPILYGKTQQRTKQKIVDAFQEEDGPRILLGNLQAAGVGWTLTRACDVVIAEPSWTPGENAQAEDRCHRIGQVRGVLIHYLVVKGSLDARILGAAVSKAEDIHKILDGGGK